MNTYFGGLPFFGQAVRIRPEECGAAEQADETANYAKDPGQTQKGGKLFRSNIASKSDLNHLQK